MKLHLFILIALLAWPFATADAADVNMKFGKPTKEEMQMTTYEADPNAEAVVLCRLTNVEYTVQTNSYLVDYREKFRIKVLKPSGARFAQVTIPYYMLPAEKNGIHASKFALRSGSIEFGSFSSASAFDEAGGSLMEDADTPQQELCCHQGYVHPLCAASSGHAGGKTEIKKI